MTATVPTMMATYARPQPMIIAPTLRKFWMAAPSVTNPQMYNGIAK